MDRGIGRWATTQSRLIGDRLALSDPDGELTFSAFEDRTNQVANALLDLGVRRGDRVAVLLYNSIAFIELLFGTAKLGAILVPINFRLQHAEVGYILADSGADVFAYHESLAGVARRAQQEHGARVRHALLVDDPSTLPSALQENASGQTSHAGAGAKTGTEEKGWKAVVAGASSRSLDMDVHLGDVHAIMYTSGTTGKPKGAMLTHANALANARNQLFSGLRPADTTVTAAPMFHIGGLGVHSLPLVYLGGCSHIVPAFEPRSFLAAMAKHRVTVQFLVPAMWAALSQIPDFDSYDLSSLRMVLSGGAPTPLPLIEFFQSKGVPFQEGFGMTETSPGVSVLEEDRMKDKAGSIGRPLPEVETRVVDANDRDVAGGQVGELVLRGENIFAGYWMKPEATAEAFKGGWFHTGDLARVDDEGFITLVDRKKDMIISGGENVYPVEVEQVLIRYPGMTEVAVFGVPDDKWGEMVVAAAAGADLDPARIIDFARSHMAHFKCPRRVEVVDALPRNATGKVLKTTLRAKYGTGSAAVNR